ncbi:hypothetical protein LSUB1_G007000 [Lachnellula subtilissima]|uniref:NAD(P)-binding protein n=1 Tax=Lachnellula subtilissima TaxID=602034 RepID=A0A8H8RND2_9HELO|nr:hypothetical protein LSUB1_G007000 [Lachnellula subtilissima]
MSNPKGSVLITGANGGLGSAFVSNLVAFPYASSHRGIYTIRDPSCAATLKTVLQNAPKTAHLVDSPTRPQKPSSEHERIVLVSSWSHDAYDSRNDSIAICRGDEYKTLWRDPEALSKGIAYHDNGYKAGMRRYGTSKLLHVMFMYELQRKLSADPALSKISVLSLDPGAMGGTGLLRDSPAFIRLLTRYLLYYLQPIMVLLKPNGIARTPKKPGYDLLLACLDEKYLGEYPKAVYLGGSEKAIPSVEARDDKKQRKLWVESLKLRRLGRDTVLKDL